MSGGIQTKTEAFENDIENSSGSDNEDAGEDISDDMVREAAALWASDYKKGDPPPIGIHRVGNKNPPTYRATVTIHSRPYHGPVRDTIEECITDRRKMLIQYKRVTRMKGKRKTNPKYFEDEIKDESSSILPLVTHVVELLDHTRASKATPSRHLCPVVLSLRVSGVQIQDAFIWSALMIVDQSTTADVYGYGQTHLQAYCVGLLSDYNICPTLDNLNHIVSAVSQQLDFSRAATLIPEESSLMEKGKYRKFPPSFNATLTDEASGYNDRFCWNAWAPDTTVKRFCDDIAQQEGITGKSRLDLEFQLLSQAIAHRQKFLDSNPHINTGIQRIFRKTEVKQTAQVRSQKVLERIARLHKMRMARRCFRNQDLAKANVPKSEVPADDRDDDDVQDSEEDLETHDHPKMEIDDEEARPEQTRMSVDIT